MLTIDFAVARRSISFLTIVEFVETKVYSIIDKGWSQGADLRQIYYSLCYFVTREYRGTQRPGFESRARLARTAHARAAPVAARLDQKVQPVAVATGALRPV